MAATPNSDVVGIRLLRHVMMTSLVYSNLNDGELNYRGENFKNDSKIKMFTVEYWDNPMCQKSGVNNMI